MKRAQLVSSGSVERMLKSAEMSWRNKEFQQSIDTLERAGRLDPGNPLIQLHLGRNYGLLYDYAAAERCFEKAVRLAPLKGEMLSLAGQRAQDFRDSDLASRLFQRALEQRDLNAETLVRAAEHAEKIRRVDQASDFVERALELNPTYPPALLIQARLERLSNRLESAERMLRTIPGGSDSATRARVCYELGAILDRQKRYDEAMSAFLEAKSIMRMDAAPFLSDLKVMRDNLATLRQNLSADTFEKWHSDGPKLEPQRRLALLGGHPRSGTTLLEQVLDSHPDALSAEETEIFIDNAFTPLSREFVQNAPILDVLQGASISSLQRSREHYFQAMESSLGQAVGNRLLIDKNPSYTFLIPSMVRLFPEMKVIVALRDPRDVVLSCFMQSFVPLGQANAAFLSLERAVDEYVALMSMWRKIQPILRNPWIEVRYEDMVEDLESVSRRVLEFLGLAWDAQVLKFDEHARQKKVRSPTYADVTKPVFKTAMGRWRNYQKYFEPHLEKLEPFVKAFGYG